jgi:hypothetical protein
MRRVPTPNVLVERRFQKNFEKSLNISEKVNITEAKEASKRMKRFMTQDADVVKFMTDMKFDYKDLHMVDNYFNKSS